jgi:hypothetical protein
MTLSVYCCSIAENVRNPQHHSSRLGTQLLANPHVLEHGRRWEPSRVVEQATTSNFITENTPEEIRRCIDSFPFI